jgi:hypothetical protein
MLDQHRKTVLFPVGRIPLISRFAFVLEREVELVNLINRDSSLLAQLGFDKLVQCDKKGLIVYERVNPYHLDTQVADLIDKPIPRGPIPHFLLRLSLDDDPHNLTMTDQAMRAILAPIGVGIVSLWLPYLPGAYRDARRKIWRCLTYPARKKPADIRETGAGKGAE